jgi:hypothetical protein
MNDCRLAQLLSASFRRLANCAVFQDNPGYEAAPLPLQCLHSWLGLFAASSSLLPPPPPLLRVVCTAFKRAESQAAAIRMPAFRTGGLGVVLVGVAECFIVAMLAESPRMNRVR